MMIVFLILISNRVSYFFGEVGIDFWIGRYFGEEISGGKDLRRYMEKRLELLNSFEIILNGCSILVSIKYYTRKLMMIIPQPN